MKLTLTAQTKNPREKANILSYCTFAWFMPTFVKGFKKTLNEEDLFETLYEQKSSYLGDLLEEAWEKEKIKGDPSLWKALWKVFGLNFISLGLLATCVELIFKIGQNLAFIEILKCYTSGKKNQCEMIHFYGAMLVICPFAVSMGTHLYMMGLQHLGMKVRVACCSLIYRKSLKISKTVFGDTTIGQLVNLLSNDVNRFDFAAVFMHSLWLSPLQTFIIIIILYKAVGHWSSIVGIIILALVVPIQIYLGKKSSVLRLETAIKTDERVKVMNEIISGMQVIKMYTWELPFVNVITNIRKEEILRLRYTALIKAVILSFINIIPKVGLFSGVIAYTLTGCTINPLYVFTLTAFYNVLKLSMNIYFPQGITQTAEANVSVKRLEKFLSHKEVYTVRPSKDKYKPIKGAISDESLNYKFGVAIENGSARWLDTINEYTLDSISVKFENSILVAIIGAVGSGKSSLLNVILKELPLYCGKLKVTGTTSYASQESWIFIGTVRENILFGETWNEKRYREVIKVCALEKDFSLFSNGDQTIVGEKGTTLSGGQRARINLARAVYKEADIYLLDDPLAAVDTYVAKQIFDDCISHFLEDKCTILVTNQLQFLKFVDHICFLQNGSMLAQGTYEDLQNSGLDFVKILEDSHDEIAAQKVLPAAEYSSEENDYEIKENKETRGKGSVGLSVYKDYFKAGGNKWIYTTLITLLIILQVSTSGGDFSVGYWAKEAINRGPTKIGNTTDYCTGQPTGMLNEDDTYYMTIYTVLTVILIISSLICSICCFQFCVQCAKNLHNDIFARIASAPMRFFHVNPSGRILNRFSKDMGIVDDYLPNVFIDAVEIALVVLGIVVVVSIVNYPLLLIGIIIFVIFYLLRIVYLATSVDIKRLEGVTRSPVFTHMNSSLQGLSTIRAFGEQEALKNTFDTLQDIHSSAWYMFIASSHTFGFLLDTVCVIYIGVITFTFLLTDDSESTGFSIGLSITQALAMTEILQWGMRQWCEVENQMTSVERIVEYTQIDNETDHQIRLCIPDDKWPENGVIEFREVKMRYAKNLPYILTNLNFTIKPEEKIGIVGRTGAGKSSIITALFQLVPTEGEIIIDNKNIESVLFQYLRSKISIIPQEPVLFSNTLRKNLDPFDNYTDIDLWNALEEVELKQVVAELPQGLLTQISEGGSNFSVGQRQLICLARAIVRKNKILVMDEATANVDPKTDSLIQSTIRRKFNNCTVLTIAHRLHTIIDSDKVLVMDAGTVKEFDHPYILLKNGDSFYGMVQQTGLAMAKNLYHMARKAYIEKYSNDYKPDVKNSTFES